MLENMMLARIPGKKATANCVFKVFNILLFMKYNQTRLKQNVDIIETCL
jgi:hypothetical protein